ncbi:type II toxin-antitoxin system VapC family toxin [Paenarthrobacter ureafaciens]|jgi:predicted nucleic acid-binding protein|uniref:type II toxin-antitoxin system VapC family toxin n=1 Tax=Paenarthrobacter TaxID=1742992 RepID=UPI002230888C|nr:PIN domain-containing protein [Paenarthrobacter sp. PAE-2]MCW3768282.1 PIN domain-containing protein [Paenarthrobacter sp. PAE-2]
MPIVSAGCYLDTSSLIRLLTPQHPSRQSLLDYLDQADLWNQLCTSKLTQLEAARVAVRDGNHNLGAQVDLFLKQITVMPISSAVLDRAMEIPFHVKSLDAIHVASAAAATVVMTSDKNMTDVLNRLQQHPDWSSAYSFKEIFG